MANNDRPLKLMLSEFLMHGKSIDRNVKFDITTALAAAKIADKITEVYREKTVAQIFSPFNQIKLTKYDFYSLSELVGVKIDMGRKNVVFVDKLEKFRGKIENQTLVQEMWRKCIIVLKVF